MSTFKYIDDEMLSAYLDRELNAKDAEEVQNAVVRNPVLAGRLAELSEINARIRQHSAVLDDRPIPAAVLQLLQGDEKPTQEREEPLHWAFPPQGRALFGAPLAIAASLTLVIGFAAGYLLQGVPQTPVVPMLATYADTLYTGTSGDRIAVSDGAGFTSRFTFEDVNGRYCRQYRLDSVNGMAENVACHDGENWTLVASMQFPGGSQSPAYRPASGPALLDSMLDGLMVGEALSLETEAELIRRQWQDAP